MLTVGVRAITGRGLRYLEYPPEPALAAEIEYVWTMQAEEPLASPLTQTTASKTSLELIVPLEGNFCAQAEQHLFGSSGHGAYLVGAMSQPRSIVTAGRCVAVGARFRPGRATTFFGVPMGQLTDRVLALSALDGAFERHLSGVAHDGRASVRCVQLVQRALQGFRPGRGRGGQDGVFAALRLIDELGGAVAIDSLADAAGSGVRQLERRFREVVGVGPKLACRIARVRRAMTFLPLKRGETWADVVHACGFYDQAHFIREFRAIAGVTPGGFADSCSAAPVSPRARMSHSYNTAPTSGGTVGW